MENILHKFRSYSYHHVIIASNTTKVQDVLNSPEFEFGKLFNPRGQDPDQNAFSYTGGRRKQDIIVHNITDGSYVILLNSSQDADFYIDEITWHSVLIPQTRSDAISVHNAGLDGTIKIVEPNGIRFYNYLNDVFDRLNCGPVGVTFYVKTFFIGYPDGSDGISNPDVAQIITTVKPLGFHIIDVQTEVSKVGSTHTISFVGAVNGVSHVSAFNRVPPGMEHLGTKGVFGSQLYLEDAIKLFETNINNISKREFEKYINDGIAAGVPADALKARRVKYEFYLDDHWKKDSNSGPYVVDNFSKVQMETTGPGVLVMDPNMKIDDAITRIMNHCSLYLIEASQGTVIDIPERPRFFTHKIETEVVSTCFPQASNDESGEWGEFILKFYINRYEIKQQKDVAFQDTSSISDETLAQNSIEFDYIFTGRNTDIIDFDMKLDGLLMLYSLKVRRNDSTQQRTSDTIPASPSQPFFQKRPYEPIPLPQAQTDSNMINHKPFSLEYASSRSLLNTLSTISAIQSKVKIKGNPRLLGNLLPTPDIDGRLSKTPAYAKINIRMPSDTPDGEYYTEPFWYQGYYYIVTADHTFSRGSFTQELDLIPLIRDERLKQIFSPGEQKKEETGNKITKIVKQKVEKQIKVGSGRNARTIKKIEEEDAEVDALAYNLAENKAKAEAAAFNSFLVNEISAYGEGQSEDLLQTGLLIGDQIKK